MTRLADARQDNFALMSLGMDYLSDSPDHGGLSIRGVDVEVLEVAQGHPLSRQNMKSPFDDPAVWLECLVVEIVIDIRRGDR